MGIASSSIPGSGTPERWQPVSGNETERDATEKKFLERPMHRVYHGPLWRNAMAMKSSEDGPLIGFSEAVRRLRTSAKRLRAARELGQVFMVQIGARWMVPKTELDRLMNVANQRGVDGGRCG